MAAIKAIEELRKHVEALGWADCTADISHRAIIELLGQVEELRARLAAVEKWQEVEDTRAREASEYS